jgi:DNA-binding NarL/FixJ family response regulator
MFAQIAYEHLHREWLELTDEDRNRFGSTFQAYYEIKARALIEEFKRRIEILNDFEEYLRNRVERNTTFQFTERERRSCFVLVVEHDEAMRTTMRQALLGLGYGAVSDSSSHLSALDKLKERPFTHIIFDARESNMTPAHFLGRALEMDSRLVTLASSLNPTADDVFGLLAEGARGYIVKPPSGNSLEESVVMATKNDLIPDVILYAKDRNLALASMVATALDKVATLRRQAVQYETARIALTKAEMSLIRATDLAKTFAKGGDEALVKAIVSVFMERATGPASRLGRTRMMLGRNRKPERMG